MDTIYTYGSDYVLVRTGQPEHAVQIGVGATIAEAREDLQDTPIQSAGRVGEAEQTALRWAVGAGWIDSLGDLIDDDGTPAWWPAEAQRDKALDVEWGDVEDYYPEHEAESRREEWAADSASWEAARDRAYGALSLEEAREALEEARYIERQWGDDPATQQVASALGVDL